MRVTMLVRCLAMMRGGGETRHLAWAKELAAVGVKVDFVTGRPLLAAARYPCDDSSITVVRSPYARDFVYRYQHRRGFGRLTMAALHADEEWFSRAAWRRIAARPTQPDVVHAHALHQAARLRRGDVPVVIHLPGAPNPWYRHDLQHADAIVADGWAAEHLPATLGRPVARVPKGVDAERFRPDGPSQRALLRLSDKRVVVTVARLVPIKNVKLLVDAVALVSERVPDVHLLVVGDGPDAETLRRHAGRLQIADSVTFVGAVPHAETPVWYRAGDVFALSSTFDNSPNVLLEAMACGLPIVATDVGGVRELVDDPAGGVLVPPNNPAALAKALHEHLTSSDAGHQAGAHNRRKASTEFSWRASALRLLDVYHGVIEARRGAACERVAEWGDGAPRSGTGG